ncbi:GNAT family N-acetyltransferase, partial [Vibrio diabolicus]
QKETIARNRFIFHGKPKDGVVYSLLPADLT